METRRHFRSLVPKMGFRWTYRRLRITQIDDFDFPETAEAGNLQIYTDVVPEGLHVVTGNNVISYFR